jgi:hypothetical protein
MSGLDGLIAERVFDTVRAVGETRSWRRYQDDGGAGCGVDGVDGIVYQAVCLQGD